MFADFATQGIRPGAVSHASEWEANAAAQAAEALEAKQAAQQQ